MSEKKSISQVESKTISLSDMIPEKAEIILGGETYTLRPITLDDRMWIKRSIGDDKMIGEAFEKIDMEIITKVVYHQLELEDKKKFLAKDVELVDDEGELVSKRLTGPEVFRQEIKSKEDELRIFNALLTTLGISQPVLEKMMNVESEKKNQQ